MKHVADQAYVSTLIYMIRTNPVQSSLSTPTHQSQLDTLKTTRVYVRNAVNFFSNLGEKVSTLSQQLNSSPRPCS